MNPNRIFHSSSEDARTSFSKGTEAKRNCGELHLVKLISLHNEKNIFSNSRAPMPHSLHSADSLYSPDSQFFFKISARLMPAT
jgi:hypothetical protein